MFLNAVARIYNLLKNDKGQGMVEYGLILALVAIAAIAILRTLGSDVSSKFQSISTELNK